MPPTLILIRHAQALHNVNQEYTIPDPDLSELGHKQCEELRESLRANPIAQKAELIVVSPMRRTVQTALRSVDWLIEKGVPIRGDAGWQENSAKPCDTGSSITKIIAEFPSVDFSSVDPVYPDKISPAASHYRDTKSALLNRAQDSLRRLYDRPEKVIIVVSHSGFLRQAVSGCWYFNADYRIFDFAESETPDSQLSLKESELTAKNGGGLGWSYKENVLIGSDLPDDPVISP